MKIPDSNYFEHPIVNPRYLKKNYAEFYEFLCKKYSNIESISEALYLWKNDMLEPPTCPVCGNITKFIGIKKGYNICCSCKCSNKYKVQKTKEIFIKKYGVDNTSKIPEVVNKRKLTCIQKYGVDNPSKCELIKQKIIDTNMSKYGCRYTSQVQSVKDKIKSTFSINYPEVGSPLLLETTKIKRDENKMY